MKIEEVIGRRIFLYRKAIQGMTQEKLGERLARYLGQPWTRQAVSHAEHGRRDFRAVELIALAKSLGVHVAWLMQPPEGTAEVELEGGIVLPAEEVEDLFLTPGQRNKVRGDAVIHNLIAQVQRHNAQAAALLAAADEHAKLSSSELYDRAGRVIGEIAEEETR